MLSETVKCLHKCKIYHQNAAQMVYFTWGYGISYIFNCQSRQQITFVCHITNTNKGLPVFQYLSHFTNIILHTGHTMQRSRDASW